LAHIVARIQATAWMPTTTHEKKFKKKQKNAELECLNSNSAIFITRMQAAVWIRATTLAKKIKKKLIRWSNLNSIASFT
jgi:hypothetical protein